jgi:ATP-dependent Clp protease adapter protein ClpS
MKFLEILHTVSPQAVERARRLEAAIALVNDGKSRREASSILQRRFELSQPTAWRIVDAAHDLAGKIDK